MRSLVTEGGRYSPPSGDFDIIFSVLFLRKYACLCFALAICVCVFFFGCLVVIGDGHGPEFSRLFKGIFADGEK